MPLASHFTPPEKFLLVMPIGPSHHPLGGIFFKNVVGHWDRDTPKGVCPVCPVLCLKTDKTNVAFCPVCRSAWLIITNLRALHSRHPGGVKI